jgi:TolA-binding protein
MSMSAPAPAAPLPPAPPARVETPEQREARIEIAIRRDAVVFGLRSELAFEEKEHKREREEAQEQYRRLQSRIERLEQDLVGLNGAFHTWCNPESQKERMARLFEAVKRGEFCAHAAAPADAIKAEIQLKGSDQVPCQSQTISQ